MMVKEWESDNQGCSTTLHCSGAQKLALSFLAASAKREYMVNSDLLIKERIMVQDRELFASTSSLGHFLPWCFR